MTLGIHHNSLAGYESAEHINWTAATEDLSTTGTGTFGNALHISGEYAELYMASTNQGEYTGAARLMFMSEGMSGQPADTKGFAINNQNGSSGRQENKITIQSRNDDGSYKNVLFEAFQDSMEFYLYGQTNIKGNLLPYTDNAYDLGSASKEWRNLYVDGSAYLDVAYADNLSATSFVLGSYYDEYSDNFVNLIRSSYDELYFGNEYAEINPTVYDYASWSHLNTHVFAADAYFQVNVRLRDYSYLYFGTGSDARIYYDGTNLIIDPKYTGTGRLSVEGLLWLKDENTEYNGYHVGVHNEFSTNPSANSAGQHTGMSLGNYFKSAYNLTANYGFRAINFFCDFYSNTASGDITSAVSSHAVLLEQSSKYTGTITDYYSYLGRSVATGQIDITNFHGYYHGEINRPGADYNYGLHLENVTGGTNNYAIKTGTGDINLGGGIVASGTEAIGTYPTGAGTRLMWIPDKAAFRAGVVTDTMWDYANVGIYSVAFGHNAKSSGYAAITAGYDCEASGDDSIALGYKCKATGLGALAVGWECHSYGDFSMALGKFMKLDTTADYSLVFGYNDSSYITYTQARTVYLYNVDLWLDGDKTISLGASQDAEIGFDGDYLFLDPKSSSGLKVGTAATDLVGFYGVAPVDQPATVSDPTDLATCITSVSALIDRLQELGLIA